MHNCHGELAGCAAILTVTKAFLNAGPGLLSERLISKR